MTNNKSLNSKGLSQALAEVELMKSGLKEMGCEIISIAEFERQRESKWVIKDEGCTWDQTFKTKAEALRHLVHEDQKLYDNCRAYIYDNYETTPNSDEQELSWMYEIAEKEAEELGYKFLKETL